MKSNIALAVEFAEKIKGIKHVLQVILFGSVALGEDTSGSDIDIAIVHDSKDRFELMKEVNKHKPDKIQTTFAHVSKLPEETELVGALAGDGLLLYGSPISVKEKKLDLKPKILISYSLEGMPQTEKVKLNRALYGSVSRSTFKGREYRTETNGLVEGPGIEKVNKGVLLAERRSAAKIINVLKRFRAKFKEIPVWAY